MLCSVDVCDGSTQPETEHNLEDVVAPDASWSVADASAISVTMPWDTQVKHAGANSPTTGGFDDGGGSISLVPGLDPVIVYDGHNPDCKKDCGTCVRVYSPPPPALAEACPMPTSMPQDVNVEASAGQDVAPRIPLDVEAPSSKGEDVATDVSASYYLTTGALVAVGLIVVVAVVVVVLGAADDDSATSSSSSSASGNTSTPVAPVTMSAMRLT